MIMEIKDFVSRFNSHPVLFIGTGISLRYLNNSFTWDSVLEKISNIVYQNEEYYLDIKARYPLNNGGFDYPKIATVIEKVFNEKLQNERNGDFSYINDLYYKTIKEGKPISRFKLYLAHLFTELNYNTEKRNELDLLKQLKNNISSIITTNYDRLLENVFEFNPIIGNDILLTNPYGSLYKIHGCVLMPDRIIITEKDYEKSKYQDELIRAQLLSLFVHNPVIFLGYGAQDENVNGILKTVFKYAEDNNEILQKIKNNFLLVEYEENSENIIVSDYDLKIDGVSIQIKKIKTDNYIALYKALIEAKYPISAMDIRKVQNIMYDIVKPIDSKEDRTVREVVIVDSKQPMSNSDRVLVVTYGNRETANTIKETVFKEKLVRTHMTADDFIINYFEILANKDIETIKVIDNLIIPSSQYFPIFGFLQVYSKLKNKAKIKKSQQDILNRFVTKEKNKIHFVTHTSIDAIYADISIATSFKHPTIIWNVWNGNIILDNLEQFLRKYPDEGKKDSKYRRLIALYDYKKYGTTNVVITKEAVK